MKDKYLNPGGVAELWQKVKTALGAKQDKLTGAAGQVVGFGADGAAVAQEVPVPKNAVTVPSGAAIEMGAGLGEGPYAFEYAEDGEGSAVSAAQVSYDGTGSGLSADTVQGAVDALSDRVDAYRLECLTKIQELTNAVMSGQVSATLASRDGTAINTRNGAGIDASKYIN